MLSENDVIEAVCSYLENRDFTILKKSTTNQKGDDIIARPQSATYKLHIEAKGETSSKEKTNNYGESFNSNQVLDHVAKAFYRAAKMLQLQDKEDKNLPRKVGIALPDNKCHKERVHAIEQSLKKLDIIVFWVSSDKKVTSILSDAVE